LSRSIAQLELARRGAGTPSPAIPVAGRTTADLVTSCTRLTSEIAGLPAGPDRTAKETEKRWQELVQSFELRIRESGTTAGSRQHEPETSKSIPPDRRGQHPYSVRAHELGVHGQAFSSSSRDDLDVGQRPAARHRRELFW